VDDTKPLKWESNAPNAYVWSEKAYDMMTAQPPTLTARLARKHGVLACSMSGSCPRCSHPIPQTIVLSAVTERASKFTEQTPIRSAGDEAVKVVAKCTCSEPHGDRPTGKTAGCGINFQLLLHEEVE
jgi:hypothetical protein